MTALRLVDVTHRYRRTAEPAVEDVSLQVNAGEVVALVGPNGAGKSTLLNLARQNRFTAGQVEWFDKPASAWRRRDLAKQVALLPQSPTALAGQQVADVLAAGRSPYWGSFGAESTADRAAVATVADELHITDWLTRDIDTLSGGQRQRVFLARCLVQVHGQPAAAILLDEPDAALDLARGVELGRLIRSLADMRGLAVMIASHDLNLAARTADRVALLSGGRLRAFGPPGEVLTESIVSEVYGLPVRRLDANGRPVLVPV